jgi:hypothetical protein
MTHRAEDIEKAFHAFGCVTAFGGRVTERNAVEYARQINEAEEMNAVPELPTNQKNIPFLSIVAKDKGGTEVCHPLVCGGCSRRKL